MRRSPEPETAASVLLRTVRDQVLRVGDQDRRDRVVDRLPGLCLHLVDEGRVLVRSGRTVTGGATALGGRELRKQRLAIPCLTMSPSVRKRPTSSRSESGVTTTWNDDGGIRGVADRVGRVHREHVRAGRNLGQEVDRLTAREPMPADGAGTVERRVDRCDARATVGDRVPERERRVVQVGRRSGDAITITGAFLSTLIPPTGPTVLQFADEVAHRARAGRRRCRSRYRREPTSSG